MHTQFPEHALCRELPEARTGDVMPAAEKATDRLVQMQLHRVSCVRDRAIGEVGRPSPHGAVQSARHVLPRRLIPGPDDPSRLIDPAQFYKMPPFPVQRLLTMAAV